MESTAKSDWRLDAQIAQDTARVGDLALCRVQVMNDATYPWVVLLPRRPDVTEVIDLSEPDRVQLMAEIATAASALKRLSGCDKLNIGAIGNVVPQLHIHIVARRHGDPAWPKPVWGVAPPVPYEPQTLHAFIEAVREAMRIA